MPYGKLGNGRYLTRAFQLEGHALNSLVHDLVEAFQASYRGVGAHRRLLTDAVEEIRSFLQRTEELVLGVFPALQDSTSLPGAQPYGFVGGFGFFEGSACFLGEFELKGVI